MAEHTIRIVLNDVPHECVVRSEQLLVDLLRDQLGLTGTKVGCGIGVCGACSVLVDDELMTSCLFPAVYVDGRTVRTVEGLSGPDGELSALQDAFIRHGGFQCGICTPGQLIAARALLDRSPHPTAEEIRAWMMGNLCRCTGYAKIVESILAAAEADDRAGV